ncbi:MAG: MSMEG_1061 family FMN-dependent PPOX-type flavoprotein [Pseudomonadota bacterium]
MSYQIETEEQLREVVGAPHPELEAKVSDRLDEFAQAFIAASPFVVISTASSDGRQDASPKGDAPGFVTIADDRTLLIPDRPGNKLAYGHRNIIANPRIGLLFVIPQTSETLRVNGTAELTSDPEVLEALAARGKPAILATRVTVEESFFHCGKAFIRSDLWKPERWGERHRVSFGEMYRKRKGLDESVATAIDAGIETDYKQNL